MDLSLEALRSIISKMIILVLSIAVHEFGHAFVADKLGDGTPRSQGRVTLNPLVHADPIGTLALPGIFLLLSGGGSMGFGWGKPVYVNPVQFSRKYRMKVAHLMVAIAGPAMNIAFGLLLGGLFVVLAKTGSVSNVELINDVFYAGLINFVLAFFNLVPAPPLDGGTVLLGVLPDRFEAGFRRYSPYGMFVVLAVMVTPLSKLFVLPAVFLYKHWLVLLGIPGQLLGI